MNAKKSLSWIGIAAVLSCAAPGAFAQDAGFYVGGALGQSSFKDACGGDPTLLVLSCDDKDSAWKIFGGYQFNKNFGAEVGYVDLGKATGSLIVLGLPGGASIKAKGFEFMGVGTLPFTDKISGYAKAGLFRWDVDADAYVSFLPVSTSDNGTDFTFGLGVKYDFTKNIGARLEYQRYNDVGSDTTTGQADIDLWSIGIVYKF
jgi:OOP family OmpA-OmpF porin